MSEVLAKRIPARNLPPPQTGIQKVGLRYERQVLRALLARGMDVEHNPWFEYWDGICCPDILIYELAFNRIIVVEVKHTSTVQALVKLRKIYCPVVEQVTGCKAFPLVITKNVSQENFADLYFNDSIYTAIMSHSPVYIWLGKGPIM